MRMLLLAVFFAAASAATMQADPNGQPPDAKKQPQNFDPPKATKPEGATLKQMAEKTVQLRSAIDALKAKGIDSQVRDEVEIYLKAAENIVRFEEWYSESSGKWATLTLDQGLARAKQAESGKATWRDAPGKWVVRAYTSTIDGSIQPYAVLLPHDYGKDPKKKWRLDIVLHGRDAALTEAKFIASHGTNVKAAPKDLDRMELEVYGRGNNAYRWAGEADVFEAYRDFASHEELRNGGEMIDKSQVVLRGFSMGGAGTWHIGLHFPFTFAAIGPGAGFTTTHGYIGGLPKQLPDYQEKCLHIYDAKDYAENAFNVPVVAYSGANDPQKAAADNIERALKDFKEPLRFTHLIAPGLQHQIPKEWQDKAQAEIKKYLGEGRKPADRSRFVTYTTRYNRFSHGFIERLEHQYEKAIVDCHWTDKELTMATQNVAALNVVSQDHKMARFITIDKQSLSVTGNESENRAVRLERTDGKWEFAERKDKPIELRKGSTSESIWLQGPIDDAFTSAFAIVRPKVAGWSPVLDKSLTASLEGFSYEWEKYFRGKLKYYHDNEKPELKEASENLVLFGDPQSNPSIAEVLPKLPIVWTKEKLVMNGVEYDAKTHIPVMIYPNPFGKPHYIVLNSGHTFHEADLKGTNALLYPRLGDWAVLKPMPTDKDPAACEVVAAGLFDENWQFPKKK